jgi:hypothetical protein
VLAYQVAVLHRQEQGVSSAGLDESIEKVDGGLSLFPVQDNAVGIPVVLEIAQQNFQPGRDGDVCIEWQASVARLKGHGDGGSDNRDLQAQGSKLCLITAVQFFIFRVFGLGQYSADEGSSMIVQLAPKHGPHVSHDLFEDTACSVVAAVDIRLFIHGSIFVDEVFSRSYVLWVLAVNANGGTVEGCHAKFRELLHSNSYVYDDTVSSLPNSFFFDLRV